MSKVKIYEYNRFLPKKRVIGGTISKDADHVHLSFGFPNSTLFPLEQLAKAASVATLEEGHRALHYSGGAGTIKVRQWVKERVKYRKIEVETTDVLITAGAGQAIDVTARALINAGDEVWVEAPSFFSALHSFRVAGATIRSFPVDEKGLKVELVEKALQDAVVSGGILPKFIYVMPNYHNPAAVTLSVERRKHLAALAQQYQFYIVEDDAYADINFSGSYLPAIHTFAPESVIYIGTFSKIIGPGIRLGWAIAGKEVAEKLNVFLLGSQTNPYTQEIIATLLESLPFEEYLKNINEVYKQHCQVAVNLVKRFFQEDVTAIEPDGGYFLFLKFKHALADNFAQEAEKFGVSIVSGKEFYVDGSGSDEIRICFTYSSLEQLELGIERLAATYYRLYTRV